MRKPRFRIYYTRESDKHFWQHKDFRTSQAREEWIDRQDKDPLWDTELENHSVDD